MTSNLKHFAISQAQVDEAWQLRVNGKMDEALLLVCKLRQTDTRLLERIDRSQLDSILRTQGWGPALDLILLQASLARGQKRLEENQRILEVVESGLLEHSLPKPFWLVFEHAIQEIGRAHV